MSAASTNTKDVMVSFLLPTLKRIDTYCKQTGLKRSTAIMQAVDRFLANPTFGVPAEPEPHTARGKDTSSLVKTKLRRK